MTLPRLLLAAALALPLAGCGKAQFYLYSLLGPDYQYAAAGAAVAAVGPPPAPGSPGDRADLEALLAWQARRTEADCAAAKAQAEAEYDRFFGGVSPFPEPLPPEAATVLFKVYYDGGKAVSAAKKKFARQRPFRREPALRPCLGRVSGLSYPSGHAAVSRLFALLLADVAPERRAQFLARADQAALNRVIGGVHHPSDIEAGKRLGDALYSELLKSGAFRADLGKLRALAVKK